MPGLAVSTVGVEYIVAIGIPSERASHGRPALRDCAVAVEKRLVPLEPGVPVCLLSST